MSDPYADLLKANGVTAPAEDDPYAALLTQAKPKTATEQYKADGGGLMKSLEKGYTALTALMAPAAAMQNQQAAAIAALMGDKRSMEIANDHTLPQRSLESGIKHYNSLPKNPLQQNVAGAYESNSGIQAPLAAIKELMSSPGLAADYMAEMLPAAVPGGLVGGTGAKLAADTILKRAIIPQAIQRIAPVAAAGAGANAGATFTGGLVPNSAGLYEENGGKLGDALRKGGLQTGVESAVAAPFGAVLPFGSGVLPTAAKALIVSPADEVAQTVSGNTAIGKDTSGGEMMTAGLLGAMSSPVDIATAIVAARQGEQGTAPAVPPQATPALDPGIPVSVQPSNTQPAIDALDAIIARSQQQAPTEAAPEADPYRALVETASPQFGATVETAQPVNLAEAFRAVVETPPPRAIVETPSPQGIVETAGGGYGTARPDLAQVAQESGEVAGNQPAESLPADVVQPAGYGMDTAAGNVAGGSGVDLAAGNAVAGTDSVELRDLTEGLIRQMRDAKQNDLDRSLRTAIDRIKSGGMAEKPAYFAKLAKEFEKRGDTKTSGMLGQVASTLTKPKAPRPSRLTPIEDGRLTQTEYQDNLPRYVGGAGWTEVGGKLLRGADGEAAGRTAWVPKADWWLTKPEGVTESILKAAAPKALSGQPMTAAEKNSVKWLLDVMEKDLTAEVSPEGAAIAEELADDLDIDLEGVSITDPAEQMRSMGFTEDEINAEQGRTKTAGETAQAGAGEGNPVGEGQAPQEGAGGQEARPDLSLTQQTERDLAERERELNQREADQNKRERDALDKEKADRQRDGYALTGSDRASDANAWRGDLLSQPASKPEPASAPITDFGDDTAFSRATQTDTPAFKAWFKGSKAVDADGKPLVLYHGTDVDFSEFSKDKIRSRFPYSIGLHFTDRTGEVNEYAKGEGGRVIPVYLDAKNPLIIKTDQMSASMEADMNRYEIVAQLVEAKRAGKPYDSVIIKRERGDEYDGMNVIVFDPVQIKSAIGNNGTFDGNNPDISFSRGNPEAAGNAGAVTQVELDAVIKRVASGWKRAQGDGGRLIAVETAADLPAAILRAADAQNVPQNEIKGVFHNGHIYLVRDNHTDARAVEETIFHEAYGHYGARLLNGNDAQKLSAAFSDLWKRIGALDGVRKMADKFGVLNQVEPYIKSLATADMPLDTKRRIIVDELLAHVAGRGEFTLKEQAKAYLGALRVGLRNAARAMKLDGIAQALDGYTDAELLLNLKQMREAVVSGNSGKGKGTLFHRVFHGTPHVWEAEPGFPHGRPRLDKMGSGEGAQAYGWGWYSAEAQNVAGGYADALRNPVELDGKKPDTMRMGFANTAIINYFQNRLAAKIGDDRARQQTAAWAKHNGQINGNMADAEIDAFIARLSEGKGNLYQLDIPDASLPYLLDWDAVWEDQPQQVRDALENTAAWEYAEERVDSRASRRGENFIGRDIYNDLLEEYSPQEASEYLASIGIVGTKYLDGNSRNNGEGSSNYVLWDQPTLDKVALLERNGETLDAMREQPMFARTATLTGQPQATQQPSDWRDPLGRLQFAPAVRLKDAANRGIAKLVAKSETAQAVYDAFKIAPPKLQVAIRKMKASQQQALDQAGEVAKATNTMTPAEKALVSDIIEGMVKPGVIPPEHIVAVADRIRSIMDVQTDELVKLGMLAKDTADRWRGKYLPRFYNRQKDPALDTWGKKLLKTAMPIRGMGGNSLKARGLFQTINVSEVGKWEALGWEVRDPLWENKSGTLELKQADKLLNDPDSVQMWRDFNQAERENMGEIRDAVFRFAMGYTSMQNDIALGRMFDAIARNQEWTRPRAEDGYVHVPETEIADTGGVKRYGNLAGLYVRKDIMSHLSQHDEGGEVLKLYRRAMGMWKMGKVPMNPVSHANNTVSNLTMAHLAGVSYWDGHKYAAAMRDFIKGAPMLDEAKETGLLTGDITRAEILAEMPQEIRDMLNMQESQLKKKGRAVYDLMTYFLRKPMLTAYRFEDDFFKYLIYRDARTQGLKPEDAMLYATQYIFNYDDLPKGARAVRDTAIPFFSYTYKAFPALIHAATHYPWRFLAPSAVVGGYGLAVYGAMAALMGGDDDEWDKALAQKEADQKNLAPWDRGKSLFLTDKTFRTGAIDDRTGLPVFVNIYRMLPGGDMLDTGHGESTTLPAPLMPSHPILGILAAMIPQINKDVFTGKELVDKNDTGAEVAKKRLNYLTDALAPAIAPTGYHADRLLNTLADSLDTTISIPFIDVDYTGIGKDGLPIQAKYAIPQTFGVKMRPVDLERNAEFDAIDDKATMLSIKREVRSAKMQVQRGSMTERQYQSVLTDAKEKINRMRDE